MTLRRILLASALTVAALASAPASAETAGFQAGDFLVRARGIGILPDSTGSTTIGGRAAASDEATAEVDVSYFLTSNWALELIAATTRHDMSARGTSLGDVDLGDVGLLPPTLTVQYHFMPDSQFKPYVGAGLTYAIFYDANSANNAVTKVQYDNAFGFALQAGMDVNVVGNWYANIDVKHIFLSTTAHLNGGAITADAHLDPTVVGMGIGYRF
jgi:outer membrane protein